MFSICYEGIKIESLNETWRRILPSDNEASWAMTAPALILFWSANRAFVGRVPAGGPSAMRRSVRGLLAVNIFSKCFIGKSSCEQLAGTKLQPIGKLTNCITKVDTRSSSDNQPDLGWTPREGIRITGLLSTYLGVSIISHRVPAAVIGFYKFHKNDFYCKVPF